MTPCVPGAVYNSPVSYSINRLVQNLRELCAERVLDEKWLIAPSRRVGMQWLDSVARSGQPVLNFRVKTLRGLALELAAPLMRERGLELVGGMRAQVLTDRVFGRLRERGNGYLSVLKPGPGLTETLARAVRDLRVAGLVSSDLRPGQFEVLSKGTDVIELTSGYEKELESRRLADYSDALRLAAERLESESPPLGGSNVVVMPDYSAAELKGLQLRFWETIPEANRVVLESDLPGETAGRKATNLSLMYFVADPAAAPPPGAVDGTVGIFRAVGEVNEVREVLRRCVERGISFDDVEILHTDNDTYVPLIFELCCRLKPDDPASIPVTFADGIPVGYSRPARALLGWLSWITADYPQSILVNLVADGLVRFDGSETRGLSSARLGAILRAVPIGGGRDRYLPLIEGELRALGRQLDEEDITDEPEDEELTREERAWRAERLRKRIAGLEALRAMTAGLLALAPPNPCSQHDYLQRARDFLASSTRAPGEFNQYCLKRLVDDIGAMAACLTDGDSEGFNPADWLADLQRETPIEGKGPRPGCLYVSSVRGGGHSGRRHTFIIGLDDSRFPGTGRQDPLLLDGERERISGELPTGAGRLRRDVDDFARLLAGIRGELTLGYCCRSLSDDREMFPSPVVLSAYRILDRRDGDQRDLARWVGDPASFAPSEPGRCIDGTEWWLSRTCGAEEAEGLERTIALSFTNLARGFAAAASRASDEFTEYDGYVPEAGAGCDPACPDGPVLSASRLQTFASCPLEYFFKYVLKVEPPEKYELDPTVWLDPGQRGELLHSAFREFMSRLADRDQKPDFSRDAGLLGEVLDDEIARWESRLPAPSLAVCERERQELCLTARIFLQEEHEHCRDCRPAYFEVSIGLEPDGQGCSLDCPDPVSIDLPGGMVIRVRGRIDRIDELPPDQGPRFAVWDYKTGSTYGYKLNDPFRQGRHVQNALYLELAAARLAELHPGASVVRSGYFFPGTRAHGERISWEEADLAGAGPILARLCTMLATGCFPFTDDPDTDMAFSDYVPAFGDTAAAAADVKRKLLNARNIVLKPFRELREYECAIEEAEQ